MSIKEKSEKDFNITANMLFAVYLVGLTWAILFKFNFNIMAIYKPEYHRNVITNLFFLTDSYVNKPDIILNIFAFIPYGFYFSALKSDWNFFFRILIMALTSLFYEATQYTFAIGCADINDVVNNTLGGVIGIIFYYITYIVFKNNINKAVNVIACAGTCVTIGFFVMLILNGSCNEFQNTLMKIFS